MFGGGDRDDGWVVPLTTREVLGICSCGDLLLQHTGHEWRLRVEEGPLLLLGGSVPPGRTKGLLSMGCSMARFNCSGIAHTKLQLQAP